MRISTIIDERKSEKFWESEKKIFLLLLGAKSDQADDENDGIHDESVDTGRKAQQT